MQYEVKLNATHYAYFPNRKYAETFINLQRNKKNGKGGPAWAAEQQWSLNKKE